MHNPMRPLRRHPLATIHNLRDLGGYAAEGGTVRWHTAFRSARLSDAAEADMAYLRQLGIRTIIDLRMEEELQSHPDICREDPSLRYVHQTLIGEYIDAVSHMEKTPSGLPVMSTLYQEMIRRGGDLFASLFAHIDEALAHGPILFHCTAGKDRTGITAMLLLALCGVDRLDIVADYETSRTYNLEFMPEDDTGSDPRNMLMLLDLLEKQYGGPVGYLKSAGVPEAALARIRAALLDPYA